LKLLIEFGLFWLAVSKGKEEIMVKIILLHTTCILAWRRCRKTKI